MLPSPKAYDTRVAGAVSKQPGLILGEQSDTKAMIAQSGRVKIKVDAKYRAIRIGDLLVMSPTPGYAMRSKAIKVGGQAIHRPGTLLGKALEALPNGKGEILVLLTLRKPDEPGSRLMPTREPRESVRPMLARRASVRDIAEPPRTTARAGLVSTAPSRQPRRPPTECR